MAITTLVKRAPRRASAIRSDTTIAIVASSHLATDILIGAFGATLPYRQGPLAVAGLGLLPAAFISRRTLHRAAMPSSVTVLAAAGCSCGWDPSRWDRGMTPRRLTYPLGVWFSTDVYPLGVPPC